MLALIPCSLSKLTDQTAPAWLMYLPSPSFQKVLLEARARASEVRIVSGLYGLVNLTQRLAPYNAHIKDAGPDRVQAFAQQVRQWWDACGDGAPVLSYCGAAYERVLVDVPFERAITGGLYDRFTGLGPLPAPAIGSTFPIVRVFAWAYANQGRTLDELKAYLQATYTHPVTRQCQFTRLFTSGFFSEVNGRFEYNGHPADPEKPLILNTR